ncbi:MAG: hypothetical protein D6732_14350 [Methanobacteriota archaeon]|nr:MAG: hypothetical protein D6732_14350 [Euryarchaeota archaeon]
MDQKYPPDLIEFDPLASTTVITPLDSSSFDTNLIKQLYNDEQLTSEEYVILDFFGAVNHMKKITKGNEVIISFQGLRRKVDIHQARLTKALNRLVEKDLLRKTPEGYTLTERGIVLSTKLMDRFGRTPDFLPTIHTHTVSGKIHVSQMDRDKILQISDEFVGKWFGEFRFVSKTDYGDRIELEWLSTNGSITAKLIFGPQNQIKISTSSVKYSNSEMELQILVDRIVNALEKKFDVWVNLESQDIYENRTKLSASDTIGSRFAA